MLLKFCVSEKLVNPAFVGWVFVWINVLFPLTASAQTSDNQLFIQKWTVDQGLPQNSIKEIVQSKSGFLYLATEAGLARFDGLNFKLYNSDNQPVLKNNRISSLYEARDGTIWFTNTASQLIRYKNGQFEEVLCFPQGTFIMSLVEDNQGNLLGARHGAFYTLIYKNSNFKKYSILQNSSIPPLELRSNAVISHDKSVLIMGRKGLYRLFDGKLTLDEPFQERFFQELEILNKTYKNFAFMCINEDRQQNLWLASNRGIVKFQNDKTTQFSLPAGTNVGFLSRIVADSQNNIWLSNTMGFLYKPNHDSLFRPYSSEIKNGILCVLPDNEGNTWIGTQSDGLIKATPNPFKHLPIPDGFQKSMQAVLYRPADSSIWAISNCSGYFSIKGRNLIKEEENITKTLRGCLISLCLDANEDILIGTSYGAIYKRTKYGLKCLAPPTDFQNRVYSILNHSKYGILVGGKGIKTLQKDSISPSRWSVEMANESISALFESSDHRLWYSSFESVGLLLPDGKAQRINAKKSSNWSDHRGVFEGKDGTIYFGTDGGGLGIFKNDKLQYLSSKNGLPNNVISFVYDSGKGYLIISSNIGLIKIYTSSLNKFLEGETQIVDCGLYNSNHGLMNSEFNGGFTPSGILIDSNRLVLSGLAGPLEVNLPLLNRTLSLPKIYLERIIDEKRVFENPTSFSTLFEGQRIEFQFTAPSFSQNKNLRFTYRLIGYDKDWVKAGSSRSAVYTKIPPGKYEFEVKVGFENGFEGSQPISIPVEIVPPYYMTLWFKLLGAILLLSGTIYATESRRRSAIKKVSQQGAFMKVVPDLMLKLDNEGKYLEYLAGNEAELVIPFEKMRGKIPEEVIPKLAPKLREQMRLATETGKVQKYVYLLKFDNQPTKAYEWRIVSIRNGAEYLLIIRNITNQATTQRKLRKNQEKLNDALQEKTTLLQQLTETETARLTAFIDAQETERNRIAQDLHDSVGQLISTAKLQVGILEQEVEKLPATKSTLSAIKQVLDTVNQEVRNISFNLLPASFNQFGLVAALKDLFNSIKMTTKIEVSFYQNTSLNFLSPRYQLYLYRIIQEAINNIVKHAHATAIEVQIIEHEDGLFVEISDDGKGFNQEQELQKVGSSGLKNMLARAQVLGGKLNFETGAAGTSLFIHIPKPISES